MDAGEYDLAYFHAQGFHRRICVVCHSAFWTLGDHDRCQEAPCSEYQFLGDPGFAKPYHVDAMREAYLAFFEHRGHTRLRRYPIVARWRNDVFFTQASIYDFQPWVTSGAIPPPANPLTISQPCARFIDIEEVGRSGRHLTSFEMMAHHAFNRADHEVYFKERTVALCQEFLTEELGGDPRRITYKEEEWEGGGNLGPSLSVGFMGCELATLVFMEYVRDGPALKPMPLTVVDTGYGLERFTWVSQGTRTAYEAAFGSAFEEIRRNFPPKEAAILVDHARTLNFLITDGVVPSNSKEGYFARLLLRRSLRVLAQVPDAPTLPDLLDRVGRDQAKVYPEIGANRADLRKVIEAEIERFHEALERGRGQIRRTEERLKREGGRVEVDQLVEWYDSLGIPPDAATAELTHPPSIPEDFYQRVAARHINDTPDEYEAPAGAGTPEPPATIPATQVLYYLDPYTLAFDATVTFADGAWIALDRTFFYPTGGGQITDTGHLGEQAVLEVARKGPHVLHRLDGPARPKAGDRVHGRVDGPRRVQLMQHHTATHLLNGALRSVLGPHVWQAGAYKGPDSARIDITHYKALSPAEIREVERLANRIVREDRPVKSYFESRSEAEKRFGFTLYQGGAVPGKELRIVEIEGFDVEACGGTHCTHTSEVGYVSLLGTERIQDGIVRLTYAAGERALDLVEARTEALKSVARKLGVGVEQVPDGVDRLLAEVEAARREAKAGQKEGVGQTAERLLGDPVATRPAGSGRVISAKLSMDRNALMELSKVLTKMAGGVAVLSGESEGRGILFIGSSAPSVPAQQILEGVRSTFAGKGGGNPAAATAVGEPGAPLETARSAAAAEAARRLTGDV
ncbi:MAG: alanine--tRNA ligase [Thermoplasmata archaeon]|nr:alanine--tRNA ligase [Thermoplasmata archaeon]